MIAGYSYRAFGFNIRSALPLPELLPGGGDADVVIRRSCTGVVDHDDLAQRMLSATEWRLLFPDLGAVTVRDGREIDVQAREGVDERSVRVAVLGPAMGVLLQQRGFLVLHASVVEIDGRAAAFLGCSGSGKSTIAAALHARGHRLVADDLAAVRVSARGPEVQAGFPQFKLWPDAVESLGRDPNALPRLDAAWAKRAARVDDGFTTRPVLPLAHLFLLCGGESLAITRLSRSEAFLTLVTQTYGIRWLHAVSGTAQFASRVEVTRAVPLDRLACPRDLGRLGAVVDLVESRMATTDA